MRSLLSRSVRRSLLGVLALTGCATVQAPQSHREFSAAERFARLLDSVEVASSLEAGEVATVPRIRLVVPPPSFTMTRYVGASFRVSDDAYALVVAVDLDRRVRVLFPESPEESGLARHSESNRLTSFFAGFGVGGTSAHYASYSRYDVTQRISRFGGGGVLLAVASDRPLQLERLMTQDGGWDEDALSRLVFEQNMPGAAHAIGRAVVLTGQEYNTDYSTFSGGRSLAGYQSLAARGRRECGIATGYSRIDAFSDEGWAFPPTYASSLPRLIGLFERDGRTYARYASGGGCGSAVYHDVPVMTPTPVAPDTTKRDSVTQWRPRAAPARVLGNREQPMTTAGLRFRRPEQLPVDGVRTLGTRLAPRESGQTSPRRLPWTTVESGLATREQGAAGRPAGPVEWRRTSERRLEKRSESSRDASQEIAREARREAPVREAPAAREPTRSEPAARERPQREPAPPAPEPIKP